MNFSLVLFIFLYFFQNIEALSPKQILFFYEGNDVGQEGRLVRSISEQFGEQVYHEEFNCTFDKGLCTDFRVRSYPGLLLKDGERSFRFRDEWTKRDLLRFLEPKINQEPIRLEAFFPSEHNAARRLFGSYAFSESWSNYDVDIIIDPRIQPTLNIWLPDEDKSKLFQYQGHFQEAELQAILNELRFPLMENFSTDYPPIRNAYTNSIAVVFLNEDLPETAHFRPEIARTLRKEFVQEFTFVVASPKKHEIILQGVGGDPEQPALLIISFPKNKYHLFPQTQAFTINNLRRFLVGFVNKRIRPILRSSPHQGEYQGFVKKVYGDTFFEDVMDRRKTVFLYLYDPAQHIHAGIENLWMRLASEYQDEDHLVFGMLNGLTDEVPWNQPLDYPIFFCITPELKKQYPEDPYDLQSMLRFERDTQKIEAWVRKKLAEMKKGKSKKVFH